MAMGMSANEQSIIAVTGRAHCVKLHFFLRIGQEDYGQILSLSDHDLFHVLYDKIHT